MNAGKTKQELYEDAKEAGIEGRSRMDKDELVDALERFSRRETAAPAADLARRAVPPACARGGDARR